MTSRLAQGGVRKGLCIVLALTLALMLGVPAGAFAKSGPTPNGGVTVPPDAYEPDDMPDEAVNLVVGAPPQAHTIHVAEDEDWTIVEVQAGKTYVFETGAAGGGGGRYIAGAPEGVYSDYPAADTILELYGEDAETMLAYSDDYGESWFSRIVYTAEESGVVFLRATAWVWDGPMGSAAAATPQDTPEGIGQYLLWVTKQTPSITGVVTDPDGMPLDDVLVQAYDGSIVEDSVAAPQQPMESGWTITDEEGRYYLFGLGDSETLVYFDADWEYGGWLVSEWYDDKPDPYSADVVTTTAGATVNGIDAQLEEVPPTFTGHVENEAGEPLEGIGAIAYYYSGWGPWYWGRDDTTDADGDYAIYDCWWASEWRVGFDDWDKDRYVTEYYDDVSDVGSAQSFYPEQYDTISGVDATLAAVPTAIEGTVTAEDTGLPIRDGYADLYWWTGSWWSYQAGSSLYPDGKYFFGTGDVSVDETYTMHFYAYDGKHVDEWYDDKPDSDSADDFYYDGTPLTIDAALALVPPLLAGNVTDAETEDPIEGVEVRIYEWNGGGYMPVDNAVTDEAGDYELYPSGGMSGPGIEPDGTKVRFYDPSGTYAGEWYDNKTTMEQATGVWFNWGETYVADAALAPKAPRLEGTDRFGTALAAAEAAFPGWENVDNVVIASGEDAGMVDALAASGLSWLYDAPLFLVTSAGVPSEVASALADVADVNDGAEVYVVGGPTRIPDSVVEDVETLTGDEEAERVFGADRYGTAAAIAERMRSEAPSYMKEVSGSYLVANGLDAQRFFDALALSPVAASSGSPILLTTFDTIPAATAAELTAGAPNAIYIAGGAPAVAPSVMTALGGYAPTVKRWSGPNRYATAVAVAEGAIAKGWNTVALVGVSASVPDALTGGATVGLQGGVMLFTSKNYLPMETYDFLYEKRGSINQCTVFGSNMAVSEDVLDDISMALIP